MFSFSFCSRTRDTIKNKESILKEALNAEKMCRRYRPQPIEVEWLTTRPTTNQPPPSSYFDSNERYYQGKHGHQENDYNFYSTYNLDLI